MKMSFLATVWAPVWSQGFDALACVYEGITNESYVSGGKAKDQCQNFRLQNNSGLILSRTSRMWIGLSVPNIAVPGTDHGAGQCGPRNIEEGNAFGPGNKLKQRWERKMPWRTPEARVKWRKSHPGLLKIEKHRAFKRQLKFLPDNYIIKTIHDVYGLSREQITPEMIELKRFQLLHFREVRELKKKCLGLKGN